MENSDAILEEIRAQHQTYVDSFKGKFQIEVVGSNVVRTIEVEDVTLKGDGEPLHLFCKDGKTYNYSTVICMKRVAE